MRDVESSVATRLVRRLPTLLAVALLLAGCGQRGPLYLPPPANAASAPAR